MKRIHAPLTAIVYQILVSPGDRITAGCAGYLGHPFVKSIVFCERVPQVASIGRFSREPALDI